MFVYNLGADDEVSFCEECNSDKLCFLPAHFQPAAVSKVKSLDSDKSFANGLSFLLGIQ